MKSAKLAKLLIQLDTKLDSTKQAVELFTNYLRKHHLITRIPSILRHLKHHQKINQNFNTLIISSPYEMNSTITKNIAEVLLIPIDTPIMFKNESKLLGGFTATFQGKKYDATLQTQVDKLHQALNQ